MLALRWLLVGQVAFAQPSSPAPTMAPAPTLTRLAIRFTPGEAHHYVNIVFFGPDPSSSASFGGAGSYRLAIVVTVQDVLDDGSAKWIHG